MSARLACLIHAANVHSEPGSNPSKICITKGFPSEFSKRSSISVCHPGQRVAVYNLPAKTHRLTNSIMLSKNNAERHSTPLFREGFHLRLEDTRVTRSARGQCIDLRDTVNPSLSVFSSKFSISRLLRFWDAFQRPSSIEITVEGQPQ